MFSSISACVSTRFPHNNDNDDNDNDNDDDNDDDNNNNDDDNDNTNNNDRPRGAHARRFRGIPGRAGGQGITPGSPPTRPTHHGKRMIAKPFAPIQKKARGNDTYFQKKSFEYQ